MTHAAILEVPLDCSGTGRGEERGPRALRAAGLVERTGARHAGEVDARVRDSRRDPATGVIGPGDIRRGAARIGEAVAAIRARGELPLVVGGDCTLLLGVFQGLPRGTGLLFVDGHADFYDAESSPTGEVADMDLAILTGRAGQELLASGRPLVEPGRVALLGHRPSSLSPDVATENARIDPAIQALTAPAIRERGLETSAVKATAQLGGGPAWLHIDLDVLDEEVFPAVTYAQPDGLDWDELVALLLRLAAGAELAGISVADFNPDRDASGGHAAEVVDAIVSLLGEVRGA